MQTAWWLLNAARGLSLSSFDSLVNTGHDMKFNLRLSIYVIQLTSHVHSVMVSVNGCNWAVSVVTNVQNVKKWCDCR